MRGYRGGWLNDESRRACVHTCILHSMQVCDVRFRNHILIRHDLTCWLTIGAPINAERLALTFTSRLEIACSTNYDDLYMHFG